MENINVADFANNIFELSEKEIYKIIEKFNENQNVDKTLTYVYIKAFYLHVVRIYLNNKKKLEKFDEIYNKYKMHLSNYYKTNNYGISDELLNDILSAFDKSFEIIESLEYNDLDDSYEFRHHIVNAFDILIQILENKSKHKIRADLFENNISSFKNQAEEILNFAQNCNIMD